MKRFLPFLLCLISAIPMMADKKQSIKFNELPDAAQKWITAYYAADQISRITKEIDDDSAKVDYDVKLRNGAEIDFDGAGVFQEIESKKAPIAKGIIPEKVMQKILAADPSAQVVKFEVKAKTYEVELLSGQELTFPCQESYSNYNF